MLSRYEAGLLLEKLVAHYSGIEWTHFTFNPWSGCTKISAGCKFCYAEASPSARRRDAIWGDGQPRKPASISYLKQPHRWNEVAEALGIRLRVFCGSMMDVGEDNPTLIAPRLELWKLIQATPHLDWLLLTKRPSTLIGWASEHGWPSNAWAGTSVEDQQAADLRIPQLLRIPGCRKRFLSCEPLLGPLQLEPWLYEPMFCRSCGSWKVIYNPNPNGLQPLQDASGEVLRCSMGVAMTGEPGSEACADCGSREIEMTGSAGWVIVGGESGHQPEVRAMHPDWPRQIRDQCAAAKTPFFFKQWGEWYGGPRLPEEHSNLQYRVCRDGQVGPISRGTPSYLELFGADGQVRRVGKFAAGRLLDGQLHDEFPVGMTTRRQG